jgi:hypothetical protein
MPNDPYQPPSPASGPIVIEVDPALWQFIPTFLTNRAVDLEKLRSAVDSGDAQLVRDIGHRIRGLGGGYGFDYVSVAGKALEHMGAAGDLTGGAEWVEGLADYLARVEPREGEPSDDE